MKLSTDRMTPAQVDCVELLAKVFTESELDLIITVLGAPQLAIMLNVGCLVESSGRRAALTIIGTILSVCNEKDYGLALFFAKANSTSMKEHTTVQ